MTRISSNTFPTAWDFAKDPQTWYDLTLYGLSHMPKKHTVIASATIASGFALYVFQPESLLAKISSIGVASATACGIVELTHHFATNLWNQRYQKIMEELRSGPPIVIPEEMIDAIKRDVDALLAKTPRQGSSIL